MPIVPRTARLALLLALLAAPAAQAQPRDALLNLPIDETSLIALQGNTRPEATAANDLGRVADATPLANMHLLLQRDAAGEQAAAAYVAAQHDPASPLFQQWLTPDQFGARFGLVVGDIDRITKWLESHGFTVNTVYPNRMVIDFSGTALQVAQAFHTEMHRFSVGGVPHLANAGDPQIPAALAPAIAGIVSLNDFPAANRYRPAARYSNAAGTRAVTPSDLAIIYNFSAAFAKGYTGTGQIIAAVEDTNLYNNADWSNFRTAFGLTGYSKGKLVVTHPAPKNGKACGNPGVNSDDVEATLDVEYASAAAPNAEILLASCASTASNGVYVATQNLVNAASPPPIISVSYGVCETVNGAAANKAFSTLYQQAAAEGISVFVATGDNGPSDCAGSGDIGASVGIGANGWATTIYNVAVGGTDFSDSYAGTTDTYWNTTNGAHWGSAKSYIPEIPWNGNCGSTLLAQVYGGSSLTYGTKGFCNDSDGKSFEALNGGEGAPSGCATGAPAKPGVVGGTCKGTPKPSWQAGFAGIRADGVRDTPDVSLFAASGAWYHYYITCFTDPSNGGAPCTGNPVNWAGGGGTSYATPIWAGIQALVNQKAGRKQGNPAPEYYKLAAAQYGKSGNADCNSNLGAKIAASCIFHDVTLGDDDSDCVKGSANCYTLSGKLGVLSTSTNSYAPAYKAGTGWDMPTGIGTVNVYNLLANWPVTP